MNKSIKKDLINDAAAKVHAAWCEEELKAYYERFVEARKSCSVQEAAQKACFKGAKKRNEFDVSVLNERKWEQLAICNFNTFKKMQEKGEIKLKRFVSREVSKQERENLGEDYVNNTENILRPFSKLSAASQKENLDAAASAAYVYVELAKRGASLKDMRAEQSKKTIGVLIHADWMRRNIDSAAERADLFVPYDKLDEWTANQDLTVFYALLDVVQAESNKYAVKQEQGLESIDYMAEEKAVLSLLSTNAGV